jgi:hypothetical protein
MDEIYGGMKTGGLGHSDHLEPTSLASYHPVTNPMGVAEGRIPFCGVREGQIEEARRRQLQWARKRHLKWHIADRLPGAALDALTKIYAQAWGAWQSVCGLTFSQTMSSSQADLIILTRAIDGGGGTLAEHELPPGNDRPLRGWFDLGERWHVGPAEPPSGKIDLLAVATHEFGHGIGLSHEPTRGVTALMDPYYNPEIRNPQAWDIAQAQARYGKPIEPVPDEPDPVPTSHEVTLILDGVAFKPALIFPA